MLQYLKSTVSLIYSSFVALRVSDINILGIAVSQNYLQGHQLNFIEVGCCLVKTDHTGKEEKVI